jgi:hypothetical protein
MIPTSRMAAAVAALAATAALALPAAAGAKAGDRTFQQTYPMASLLCAKVAAGTEGKHLKRFATQVLADCTALQSGFTAAQSTVLAARAALTPQIVADRAAITAACPTPGAQSAPCVHARSINELAIHKLRHQLRHASRRYWRTIELNRRHFWNAIRGLPGERRVHQDLPIAEQNS